MTPAIPCDVRHCWEIDLDWKVTHGGMQARVTFEDYMGLARVQYHGHKHISCYALELVQWLVSDEVPHSWGFLAGMKATVADVREAEGG